MQTRFTSLFMAIMAVKTVMFSSLAFAAVIGPVPVFEPDHFLSYDIKAAPYFTDRVTLSDQFIGPVDFIVDRPIKLLNPTLKRHNNQVYKIKYPKLHYTAYQIKPLEDVRVNVKVLVYNQFGQFIFDEFRPSRLLAPTRKILTPTSPNPADDVDASLASKADHYLCYDVLPQTVVSEPGYLKDQFRARGFETLIAKRLCNPVAKKHGDKYFEVAHPDETNHLLCFELPKKRIFKMSVLIDQFGTKGAVALNDDELCVPSVKIKLSTDRCEGSFPDFEGQCNGVCPNATDVCLPDTTSQLCRCWSEEPKKCEERVPNAEGICNGECPDNSVCVANPVNDSCECREQTITCARIDGQCGGSCPNTDEVCVTVPGTIECDCIPLK